MNMNQLFNEVEESSTTSNANFVRRFLFANLPIRGAFVVLTDVWNTISSQREYPEGVKALLGELLALNILLTSNIKIKGKLTAQIQDNPKLNLAVSECTESLKVRAMAKFTKSTQNDEQLDYFDCIQKGNIVVSAQSVKGIHYQSIIGMNGLILPEAFSEYMLQSEQLNSKFLVSYSDNKIVGFMLQQLPDTANQYTEEVTRIFSLAQNLSEIELNHTDINNLPVILQNAFSEDDILIFDPQPVKFECTCSREKVSNMICSLGFNEAKSIIEEEGEITINCDFCNSKYVYTLNDIESVFDLLNLSSEDEIDSENIIH